MRNAILAVVVLATLFAHVATGISHAQGPSSQPSANASLRAALAQKVTLSANKTPLREVLAVLARQIRVKMEVDQGALSEVGIDPASPVTIDRTNLSARSALESLLRNLQLSWYLDDHAIRITTVEQARRTLEAVVYDLTDLTRVEGKPAEEADSEAEAEAWRNLISQAVAPDQWRDLGGTGIHKQFIVPGRVAVVITHTSAVHGQIEELLSQLRQVETTKRRSPQALWTASSSDKAFVRRALQRKIDLKFQKVPLRQAMESFGRLVQLDVEFDDQSIGAAGVAMDAPITYERSGASGRTALESMLRGVGLTWLPLEGGILVVSADEVANRAEFVVHDVTDLIERPKDEDASGSFDSLLDAITDLGGTSWPGGIGPQGGNLVTLPHAQVLVVTQFPTLQEELASFFAQIRAITASRGKLGPTAAPIVSVPTTGKAATLRILEKKISLRLKDVPLQRAIEQVGREIGRAVELDKRSLDEAGISLDTPVTYRGTKVSARAALDAILDESGLSWIAEEDMLWITTHDEVANRVEVVVYDVTDLMAGKDKDIKVRPTRKNADVEDDQSDEPVDTLVEALRASIHPDTWSDAGGLGSAAILRLSQATILIVSQTQRIQEEVADCLASFRKAGGENPRK